MELAKPRVDIGLATDRLPAMLAFWRDQAGARFDHVLPIRRGLEQHRHDVNGSVLKINHGVDPLPDNPPSGYRELVIARKGPVRRIVDPHGVQVTLSPPDPAGTHQIGIVMAVRALSVHRQFYAEALGFPEEPWERGAAFRAGESLIMLEERADAPADAQMQGRGWRYITFQVFKCDETHAAVLAGGGREAMAPMTLGTTARISMVRDPDGNWIELSQRASIVGSLV